MRTLIVDAITDARERYAEARSLIHAAYGGLHQRAIERNPGCADATVHVTAMIVHCHLDLHDGTIVAVHREIDERIGDLVGQLVGMSGKHRFGEAKTAARIGSQTVCDRYHRDSAGEGSGVLVVTHSARSCSGPPPSTPTWTGVPRAQNGRCTAGLTNSR